MISSVQPAQPHEENPQLLRAIGRKKAAGFTLEQRRYAFTNTFTEEESKALYERYHIPGQYGCCGALEPGHQDTFVNYDNDDRAPLLFISGGEDPTSCLRASSAPTAKHYKSNTVTEVKEYPGYAHFLPAQKGWEQIADDAPAWAVEHAW
jgi:pimeloyl-ACP methyl ester carboxylesterase